MQKILSDLSREHVEVSEIINKHGKSAWLYLTARLLNNGFYMEKNLDLPCFIYLPDRNASDYKLDSMLSQLNENFFFIDAVGADYNLLLSFVDKCKTGEYQNKALKVIKKYGDWLTSMLLPTHEFDLFIASRYSHTNAIRIWNKNNNNLHKLVAEIKGERQKGSNSKSKKNFKDWENREEP
jgi:hypothetical protein